MPNVRISLEAVRVNCRITQEQFANELYVSKGTVWNWENGKGEPTLSQLRKMSELSTIPIDFIFVPEQS